MKSEVLIVLAPIMISSLLIGALAYPMYKRQVRPNRLYGLRTRATLSDPEVWYEANARSGRDTMIWCVATAVLALALAPFQKRLGTDAYAGLCLGASGVGMLLVAVRGWRTANQLLARRERGEWPPD